MPTSPTSGPGGAGGPAAGSYLPTANASGVTVDTTTYADPIAGGGAKLATLVFPADQGALAIAKTGDAFPRWLFASDGHDGVYMGTGAFDPYNNGPALSETHTGGLSLFAPSGKEIYLGAVANGQAASAPAHVPQLTQLSPFTSVVSGALSTVALVSGAAQVISNNSDVEAVTPVTFNPTAGAAATCKVELSPDNVTYSTLGIETEPAGIAFDGTIHLVKVRVPCTWYLRLTTVNAVLGATTYY